VDGLGVVDRVIRLGGEWIVWVRSPSTVLPFVIRKGSIAIDGTSLTIADVEGELFSVALIPTTLERTTLGRLEPGVEVNLETDILTRTVVHRLDELLAGRASRSLTLSTLQEAGFA
jgi:riboflavin synthase